MVSWLEVSKVPPPDPTSFRCHPGGGYRHRYELTGGSVAVVQQIHQHACPTRKFHGCCRAPLTPCVTPTRALCSALPRSRMPYMIPSNRSTTISEFLVGLSPLLLVLAGPNVYNTNDSVRFRCSRKNVLHTHHQARTASNKRPRRLRSEEEEEEEKEVEAGEPDEASE